MSQRDYLVEIQGEASAFTGAGSSPTPTWGQTLVEAILTPPPIQTMGIGPYDGSFQNGGMTVEVDDVTSYLQSRTTSPKTTLTADLTSSGTTATVTSTSAFSSSGTIWIGGEAMTYSGKTATTFTGLTRGALGTVAKAHSKTRAPTDAKTVVYGYNPTWFGRKVWVHTFDPSTAGMTLTTIAVGYVDGVGFTESGFSLNLISVAQQLENESIGNSLRAKGKLLGTIDRSQRKVVVQSVLPAIGSSLELVLELEDPARPFRYDDTATAGQLAPVDYGAVKVGDEVIRYRRSAYPAWRSPVNNIATGGAYGPGIQTWLRPWLRVGHTVRFTDSGSGDTIDAVITRIEQTGHWIYHNQVGFAPSVGSYLTTPSMQRVDQLERAQAGTVADEHDTGADCEQVYVQTADHVDAVLQLLLSGNGGGSVYDVLPEGFGAALSDSEINVTSFETLREYSVPHTISISESTSPKALLQELAHVTGGRIYVSNDGRLTARRDFVLYPDLGAVRTFTSNDLRAIPAWSTSTARIYNHWVWKFDGNVSSIFEVEASKYLYGLRKFPEVTGDRVQSFAAGVSLGIAEAVAFSTLLRYSDPTPELTIEIPEDETDILEPGQYVIVTLLHLPDQAAGAGLTAVPFEVLEYSPNGETVTVRLLRLPPQGNVGLVGPAAIVQSVAGSDITIEPASTSHLAGDTDYSNTPLSDILGSGRDGTEDVDWFLPNDPVELIDVSTLGGTNTTSNTTISSVDYPGRVLTLSSVPGWLAAGDVIRLDDYLTVKSGLTQSSRTPYFLWWSDATPILSGGDDPYEWGM